AGGDDGEDRDGGQQSDAALPEDGARDACRSDSGEDAGEDVAEESGGGNAGEAGQDGAAEPAWNERQRGAGQAQHQPGERQEGGRTAGPRRRPEAPGADQLRAGG